MRLHGLICSMKLGCARRVLCIMVKINCDRICMVGSAALLVHCHAVQGILLLKVLVVLELSMGKRKLGSL